MTVEIDAEVRRVLERHTVAVVGCSATPEKDAHKIPKYLQAQGYDIIPVNPTVDVVSDDCLRFALRRQRGIQYRGCVSSRP